MDDLDYTPDDDVIIHPEGSVRLICANYQSHEAGLPELIKNSADAYAREVAPEEKRVIIIIFNHNRKNVTPSISCLDFSGMTSQSIEDNFRHWADPDAARGENSAVAVQGGHGNGGKCYLTQMFENYSRIYTVKNRLGNMYGVSGKSFRFGYIPDREKGRNFKAENIKNQLELALELNGYDLNTIEQAAQEALRLADGFTLVTGVGPKGYREKLPIKSLIENLQEHPQMIITLELCKVYIVVNGILQNKGDYLSPPRIKPMDEGKEPRAISIPEKLLDEATGEEVSTIQDGALPTGTLTLLTSQTGMGYKKKVRHNILYKAQSGLIGCTPITEFDVISPYKSNIYGVCELRALEEYKQNDRVNLSDSPLTRAIDRFISDQIQEYGEFFESVNRRKSDHEEKNAISAMNEALDQWKNRFLKEIMQNMWGGGGLGRKIIVTPPLPSGKPERMELTLSYRKAGVGISIKPAIKFFDKDDNRIRAVPFRWVSDDNNIAMVDDDIMIINTFSYGKTDIYAETIDVKVRSDIVSLEVVRIYKIEIVPNEIEIFAGSRNKLQALCHLANGEITSEVYLEWISIDDEIAGVNSSGTVFGINAGETQITTADSNCDAKNPASVKVVPGRGKGSGEKRGSGFPRVLVSGEFDRDPDTGEYRYLSKHHPPVWQDVPDVNQNIWWINSAAPLARLYLDTYKYKSREWRMYHLERYIEVITQIALIHGPEEGEMLSVGEWIYQWGDKVATIQEKACSELSGFISNGDLPA